MPCGNRGYPSDDSIARLYNEKECYSMGGIPWGENYCHYIDENDKGGSYSADCAYLNHRPFDWFLRQPTWVQVAAGGVALGGAWWLLKKRK